MPAASPSKLALGCCSIETSSEYKNDRPPLKFSVACHTSVSRLTSKAGRLVGRSDVPVGSPAAFPAFWYLPPCFRDPLPNEGAPHPHCGAPRGSWLVGSAGPRAHEFVSGCGGATGTVQSSSVRPPSSITRRASVRAGQCLVPARLLANARAAAPSIVDKDSVRMISGTPRRNLFNWIRNVTAASSVQSFSNRSLNLSSDPVELPMSERIARPHKI